jgi:hypothetical protein
VGLPAVVSVPVVEAAESLGGFAAFLCIADVLPVLLLCCSLR